MPTEIRIELGKGVRAALAKIGPEAAERASRRAAERFGLVMLRELAENSGPPYVKRRTGTLGRSWRFVAGAGRISFFNLARSPNRGIPYAAFLEFGTKRHEVKPRFKKALRWRTRGRSPISAFRAAQASRASNFHFSKGHFVSGIKPVRIFQVTYRQNVEALAASLGMEVGKELGSGSKP